MIPEWFLHIAEKPYVLGPLAAVAILAPTVLAIELRQRNRSGRQWWQAAAPWLIPLVTSAGLIIAVIQFGLDGAGDLASILAVVAAAVGIALGSAAQWAAVYRAGISPSGDNGMSPLPRVDPPLHDDPPPQTGLAA